MLNIAIKSVIYCTVDMLVRVIAFYSMMFFTMSKGRGKMTVEFFSALILLNV